MFGDTAFLGVTAQTTSGNPVPGVTIEFTSSATSLNPGLMLSGTTDANGRVVVSYTYDGSSGPGDDEWTASVGSGAINSNPAIVTWVATLNPPGPGPGPGPSPTRDDGPPLKDDDSFFGLAMDPWMLLILVGGLPLIKPRSRKKM